MVVDGWNGEIGEYHKPYGYYTVSNNEFRNMGYEQCDMKCGSLEIPNNAPAFEVTGSWDVYTIETINGVENQSKVSGEFTIQHLGN